MTHPSARQSLVFGVIFIASLIILLPLRLVLGWTGLGAKGVSAQHVTGSIWSGQLKDAQIGGIALGDVSAAVLPAHLVTGDVRIAVSGKSKTPLHGNVDLVRHGFGLGNFDTSLRASGVLAQFPIVTLDLSDVTVRFLRDQCVTAQGRIRAALAGSINGAPLPRTLAGSPRCAGQALLLPLVSTSGNESLTLRVGGNGHYSVDMAIGTGDPALAGQLQHAGFQPSAKGYMLSFEGQLRGR